MTLANKLTFLRLGLIPIFMWVLAFPHVWCRILALLIFIGASLTDLYDGRVARRTGTVTRLGMFLDPLADKLLIAAAFISFIEIHELHIAAWMVIVIIAREFLITGLRTLAASRGVLIAADPVGKWKTAAQLAAIITILLILIVNALFEERPAVFWTLPHGFLHGLVVFLVKAPSVLVCIAMLITVISGMLYIRKYRRLLREEMAMSKTPHA